MAKLLILIHLQFSSLRTNVVVLTDNHNWLYKRRLYSLIKPVDIVDRLVTELHKVCLFWELGVAGAGGKNEINNCY